MPSSPPPSRTARASWLAGRQPYLDDPAGAVALLKQANGSGDHLLAIGIAEAVLATQPAERAGIVQQMARALAVLGSLDAARGHLDKLAAEEGASAETSGLLGRVEKDLAAGSTTPEGRAQHLQAALANYASGFSSASAAGDSAGAAYCGINAAAISVLLDDPATAKEIAERTLIHAGEGADYYSLATRAEAHLILGNESEARNQYEEAARLACAEKRLADLASTRRQCRELCLKLHGRRDHLDVCFPSGGIAIFSGQPDLEPTEEEAISVRGMLSGWLAERRIREVFGSLKSRWDIILLEAARDAGLDLHISMGVAPAGEDPARLHVLLNQASSLMEPPSEGEDDPGFIDRMMTARAALRADHLGFTLEALAVGADFSATALPFWQRKNLHVSARRPAAPEEDAVPDKEAPADAVPFPRALAKAKDKSEVLALLHFHFADYTNFGQGGPVVFQKAVLGPIAARLAIAAHPPLARQGFGADYLFLFDDLHAAAVVCFDLLQALGESGTLGRPSVCLHAGPLVQLVNPVLNFHSHEGTSILRAAAVAAAMPAGTVAATESFTALSSLEAIRGFRFEHSGEILLGNSSERIFRVQPA
ncbi:hypothetical protein OVA24_11245 [Luteolibacter sp. SL250]|uniref:tetratricopeptide repeat-containing protein n=1 Tax=Luteolibacter sp. SL250 TaxID=2995170 RepID=UPI00226E6B56|nr:tetratricopeptide repeat-containing protein [Luteolibacter sp. SL250]WAC17818.1 hypothetical protein OVA24_11245 [Luteolibacter sp. SL250]